MKKSETLSAELIAAVEEVTELVTGIDFATFLDAYRLTAGQENLTAEDLVAEILEAGGYQAEDETSFEDQVMIGAIAIGGPLGLV